VGKLFFNFIGKFPCHSLHKITVPVREFEFIGSLKAFFQKIFKFYNIFAELFILRRNPVCFSVILKGTFNIVFCTVYITHELVCFVVKTAD